METPSAISSRSRVRVCHASGTGCSGSAPSPRRVLWQRHRRRGARHGARGQSPALRVRARPRNSFPWARPRSDERQYRWRTRDVAGLLNTAGAKHDSSALCGEHRTAPKTDRPNSRFRGAETRSPDHSAAARRHASRGAWKVLKSRL